MSDQDIPQIYLVTPQVISLHQFSQDLARVLDSHDIACVRLAMAGSDSTEIGKAADALRDVTHARDVALVIDSPLSPVQTHGLDGVHLRDGARSLRDARKSLGPDAIIGSFCGASRHDGMTAGEAGADYISFGPLQDTGLGTGEVAETDLFAWWSEMIEVPVVAEGGLTHDIAAQLASVTDFLAIGDEIWQSDDPSAELDAYLRAMG